MNVNALYAIEPGKIVVKQEPFSFENIGDDMIAGKTLYTMVSSGTEFNGVFMNGLNVTYPCEMGYTAVFKVEHKGKNVKGIDIGDVVFTKGRHRSYLMDDYKNVVKIPKTVSPIDALFIRIAGVSMATLKQTRIPAGELVMVTGLGPVGFAAMQIYSCFGYEVIGVEPDENRRKIAENAGFTVFETVPFAKEKYNKKIALALECSGIESAVLDCCNIVRPRGEVSLIGVPWRKCCDIHSHQILHSVFHNFVNMYSGWENVLPRESTQFSYMSANQNFRTALRFIENKKMNFNGTYTVRSYKEAQQVFEAIKNKKGNIFHIFSWDE